MLKTSLLKRLFTTLTRHTPASVALTYALLASIFIVLPNFMLKSSDLEFRLRFELFQQLFFVVVSGGLIYLALARRYKYNRKLIPLADKDISPYKTRYLAAILIVLSLTIPLLGALYAHLKIPQIEQQTYSQLNAIARLNAELKATVAKIYQLRKDIDAIVAEIEGEEQQA